MMTKYVVWSNKHLKGALCLIMGEDDLKSEVNCRLASNDWVHVACKCPLEGGYIHRLYIPSELGRWELMPTMGPEVMQLLA